MGCVPYGDNYVEIFSHIKVPCGECLFFVTSSGFGQSYCLIHQREIGFVFVRHCIYRNSVNDVKNYRRGDQLSLTV